MTCRIASGAALVHAVRAPRAAAEVDIYLLSPRRPTVMCHSGVVAVAPFSVSSERVGEYVVIAVTGEVDAHTAEQVRDAVEAGITPGARVVGDLSEVTFLDSTGLGVFVTALKHLREQDGSLDLVVTSPRVMKVFELTGLDVVIPIHEDRATAVAT